MEVDMTTTSTREIGPVGTAVRVLVGLGLLVLTFLDKPAGLIGGLDLYELLLGFAALPTVAIGLGSRPAATRTDQCGSLAPSASPSTSA
jgi:hypothetical protein